MKSQERTLRTGQHTAIRVDTMLSAALIAEFIAPSDHLWLVSAWITDVQVLDNSHGAYDALFGGTPPAGCRLSDAVARIAHGGAQVHVVTRDDPHNEDFLRRLMKAASGRKLHIVRDPDIHEKTLCGNDWMLSGSMNFTIRGMARNDEKITYRAGSDAAAQARIDLAERWGNGE
ncbi:phospholipase D-like domain-containing protein DpdK [Streptomyces sp. NRRL F-5065]|uniref:phospholipase D-like domain-containing protein DpdK n=1 Tax=Streptomyces sp. NRRL F-5065 TaxID=1463855 RepID=UPI0004C1444B|nr:phospholipase D-like domain-containing protein DpdK [Streptomyces sp. NRRL F-5065]